MRDPEGLVGISFVSVTPPTLEIHRQTDDPQSKKLQEEVNRSGTQERDDKTGQTESTEQELKDLSCSRESKMIRHWLEA